MIDLWIDTLRVLQLDSLDEPERLERIRECLEPLILLQGKIEFGLAEESKISKEIRIKILALIGRKSK